MGKPFAKELEQISNTINWASTQTVNELHTAIYDNSLNRPFYIVGSGGSLSACYFMADLLQSRGFFAKAVTPLNTKSLLVGLRNSILIFISSSGKNTDIISSYKRCIEQEPSIAISICLKKNTPLKKLSNSYSISRHFEFELPSGKDGFLATNSLVAFFILLQKSININENVHTAYHTSQSDDFKLFSRKVSKRKTCVVLYGSWGQSVAMDLESKFSEAALGNVMVSDYRNFGHGRHHWFDKRGKDSFVVALITPNEKRLAEKTLSLLPLAIPKLMISTEYEFSEGSIDLLVKSFHLVKEIGIINKIDPGRPGVPEYGRTLYNLKYESLLSNDQLQQPRGLERLSISRKVQSITLLSDTELSTWSKAYNLFTEKMRAAKFGSAIFDYDGTLCSTENRYDGLSKEIIDELVKILNKGFIIGIASGRGKSIRDDLQKQIPKQYWDSVVLAYYNGSDVGILSDNSLPIKDIKTHISLLKLIEAIKSNAYLNDKLKIEERPLQLVIDIANKFEWAKVKPALYHLLMSLRLTDIQMVVSSHSCDIIIKPQVTKLNIIDTVKKLALNKNISDECICIGDCGQYQGNDFELLTYPFSLSVDEVSYDPNSCWNFSRPGMKGVNSTIEYLAKFKFYKDYFAIDL
jgi:hydroxymethylpyrimidine pyrophosphatase-like HAD family hydrolase